MGWLVLMSLLTLFGAAGVVVSVNQLRWQRRVAQEVRSLTAVKPSQTPRPAVVELPPPVAGYRQLAVGDRPPVRTLELRHVGTFCMSSPSKPMPIRGRQLFTADPPGFVWSARIQMFPGVWVDARDMAANSEGSMRVLLDSTVSIATAHGPELDQGSALRLLAEMVWYPRRSSIRATSRGLQSMGTTRQRPFALASAMEPVPSNSAPMACPLA